MLYTNKWRAVANGLRTEHPIPELPFVDDAHIPVEDPVGIERTGRKKAEGMWGRQDPIADGGGWTAFTTDPVRTDLAWCVRWHPEHGRSVVLYTDEDASSVHMALWGPALLFRAGGYWWDGQTWYRPLQVWDRAGETYLPRPVPAASTVTVAGLRAVAGDADRAELLSIVDVDPERPLSGRWADHLALWTARHVERGGLPLERCVVGLNAPELSADQLLGVAELAQVAGVAASTLRAYQARGENDVPLPQTVVSGRNMWSRPVAEEYAEARRQDPAAIAATMHTQLGEASMARGIVELWQRFTRTFLVELWEKPTVRRRWALRWRTEKSVHEVAEVLSWQVVAGLQRIVPMSQLGTILRYAILYDLTEQIDNHRQLAEFNGEEPDNSSFGMAPAVCDMISWYIRHDPAAAHAVLAEVVGHAEQHLGIVREDLVYALHTAAVMHDTTDSNAFEEFFDRLLPSREP